MNFPVPEAAPDKTAEVPPVNPPPIPVQPVTPIPATSFDPAPASLPDNAAPVQSMQAPLKSVPQGYKIQVGDILKFRVLDEPDMDLSIRVGKEGLVNIPYIDTAPVAGKSIGEAIDVIQTLLKEYYIAPLVALEISEFSKREFTIIGQIGTPGVYSVPTMRDSIGLMEAIASAGGLTRYGDLSRISVKRVVNGEEQSLQIDGRPIARGDSGQQFAILPGDTININVSFSNNQFVIMGEVKAPGTYELPPLTESIDLIDALSMAGGIGAGDLAEVLVKRKDNGADRIISVDAKMLKAMGRNQKADHFFILPGDTVAVKKAKTEFIILGQVRSPGMYQIPPQEDSISLIEALALAGGATRLGNLGNVLIRRVQDGKDESVSVNAKEMGSDKDHPMFMVMPGDRIMVRERVF